MKERRRTERFRTALDAEYTKVKNCVVLHSLGIARNISLGGLCARLGMIVRKGDELLIELASARNIRSAVIAKVVWTKPAEDKAFKLCGLKFLWASSRKHIRDCVASAQVTA